MNKLPSAESALARTKSSAPETPLDQFYRYDDLTPLVQAFATEYPRLMRVESIGKSHEGRAEVALNE